MDSIIVGFSRPKTWKPFAWLIMVGYGIPYDHVFIRWHSSKLNRDIVYQASSVMVNFMGQQFFDNNSVVDQFEVTISPENKLAMVQFAMDNAGKSYGIKECFGLAWVRICALFGRKTTNPFKEVGQTYVCSQLVAYILEEYAGAEIPKSLDDITPLDMYNYMMSVKAKQITSQSSEQS